jgi:2-polyprenyl-6-hydroxyphenyl methylase/3-demethylubiquinone-9 3-methyltransferase
MKSPTLRRKLAALSGLAPKHRFDQATSCKLCGHAAPPFDVVDFWKFCSQNNFYGFGLSGIPVAYHRCPWCRFLFTRFFDDWSQQDFQRFIYNDDYVRVDGAYAGVRPAKDAESVARLLEGLPTDIRILDYGSGSGLFEAALRKRGYTDVTSYDPFVSAAPPEGTFDLITLFEVIEHVPDPEAALRSVITWAGPGAAILFSSGFQPREITTLRGNWWYVGPRNGHCSVFAAETMAILAERLGWSLRGQAGLCALQSWPPSTVTRHVTRAMPPPLFVRHLAAPGEEAGDGTATVPRAWYRVETGLAGSFRWTARPHTEWELDAIPQTPALVRLMLPYLIETAPGYAESCTLYLEGEALKTSIIEGVLVGEATVRIEHPLAASLRGPDFPPKPDPKQRKIGLAIPLR